MKSLADDIRFIFTGKPNLSGSGSFFVGSVFFWVLLALMIVGAAVVYLAFRKVAAMRADVAGTKNRRATKMAQKRLKLAGEYLDKSLYTAFYEELHKALIGFVSDKLNMDMSEISKDNIVSALTEGGVSEEQTKAFTDLLDACEFARYSPDGGNEAMRSHYDAALKVISSIDSGLKTGGKSLKKVASVVILLLSLGASMNIQAKDLDSLWTAGVQAYTDGKFADASTAWTSIEESGQKSAKLYYNLGNAWFKQGNYPKAILNYERALRLDPSYSDARYNLEFTGNFVQDKIEPVPEFILKSVARKVCYVMGSNAWAVIFLDDGTSVSAGFVGRQKTCWLLLRNRASVAFRRGFEFLCLAEIRQYEDRHGDRDVTCLFSEKFAVLRLVKGSLRNPRRHKGHDSGRGWLLEEHLSCGRSSRLAPGRRS